MSFNPQVFFLAGLWIGWCFLHSLLISHWFTDRMRILLQERFAFYRLGFNLFSLLTIIPIIIYQSRLEQEVLFDWQGVWRMPQDILYVFAFLLFYSGYLEYDMKYVMGLSQARNYGHWARPKAMEFKAGGILQFIRHPWYTATIMLIWAFGVISDVTLVVKSILCIYVIIGTVLEERKLLVEIGEPYREYCRKVPMLIPWKF